MATRRSAARVVDYRGSYLVASFFPFASYAVNYRTVIWEPYTDCINVVPGLCYIVLFENFDPIESARLVLKEADVGVEAGPDILVFIPSALLTQRAQVTETKLAIRERAFCPGETR